MTNTKRKSEVAPSQIIAARGTLSQQQAAAALGISERTLRNYEKGVTAMLPSLLASLRALNEQR